MHHAFILMFGTKPQGFGKFEPQPSHLLQFRCASHLEWLESPLELFRIKMDISELFFRCSTLIWLNTKKNEKSFICKNLYDEGFMYCTSPSSFCLEVVLCMSLIFLKMWRWWYWEFEDDNKDKGNLITDNWDITFSDKILFDTFFENQKS